MLLLKYFEDAFLSSVSILAVIDCFLPYTVAPEDDEAELPFSNACTGPRSVLSQRTTVDLSSSSPRRRNLSHPLNRPTD